ncbi:mutT/nudix family protein, partial [Vibrio cholerae O1 str. NHCC-004A]
PLSRGGFGCCV